MPETRLLATTQPRTTTLPRAQTIPHPGGNAIAGSYLSASPAAGAHAHAHVAAARAAAAHPAGLPSRPPGTRPQDARVELIQRPGAAHAPARGGGFAGGPGGVMLASNQRPTVEIIPRVQPGQAQVQVPPGGGVALDLAEAMLVGNLLHQFVDAAAKSGDKINEELGSRALLKVTNNVHALMALMAQAPAPPTGAVAPTPTRVQVPAHPTSPPMPAHAAPFVAMPGPPVVAQAMPIQGAAAFGHAPVVTQAMGPIVVPAWPPAAPAVAAPAPTPVQAAPVAADAAPAGVAQPNDGHGGIPQ